MENHRPTTTNIVQNASGGCIHITGELPATIKNSKTASGMIYIADSRDNLLGLDSICNAVSRSPAQSAIIEQTDDTIKHFCPVFTDDLGCSTQTEVTSAIPVFQLKLLEQPWSWIHVDFAGPINGFRFLVVVNAYSKWSEIFQCRRQILTQW